MPDFSGLQIGLSALQAHRRSLDVAGHNLANVNTEGFSRQRVALASAAGPLAPAIHAKWVGTGEGVRSGTIERLRDQFLDLRGYQEHAADARLRQTEGTLERVELAFGEPSDTGLAAQLADFWAGWDDVANRPDDLAARAQLLERASTLASGFRRLDADLSAMRESSTEQLSAVVSEVNAIAARVADLNHAIQGAVNGGLNASDLQDQRDVLIGHLADRVGVTIRNNDAGTVDVYVGGTALVRGTSSETLEVQIGAGGDATVNWTKDGILATLSGRAGGLIDSINDLIPRYQAELTAVADSVRIETNALHATGFDLDGAAGLDFFVVGPDGIELNAAVAADPRKVAAANAAGTLDGSVASAIASLTGPDDQYRQLVVALGVESQTASRRVAIQDVITRQIDAAREATAGVNVDEEMTNLLSAQHAYNAAARFVTAVDETLETLIRGTGTVGR